MQGWGKYGDFRKRYLTELIGRCRHLALLPANVVAARWEYRRRAVELENLYTPLSLGEERTDVRPDEISGAFRLQGKDNRSRLLRGWQDFLQMIRPPIKPSAGELGKIIGANRRLIIRGDPGSGKTTLLRYLAITCGRSIRKN